MLSRIWKRLFASPAAVPEAQLEPQIINHPSAVADRISTDVEAATLEPDIVVFDTETTGLAAYDRVVSLGAVRLGPDLAFKQSLHLVFNPGRESHWAATRVHGLSDHYLSFQPAFSDHLDEIMSFFAGTKLVAHNLDFDTRMLNRELVLCGAAPLSKVHGSRCTMLEWRAKSGQGKGGLDIAISHLGLARKGHIHGALEDAILAAGVLRWLEGLPHAACGELLAPSNERAIPVSVRKPRGRPRAATAATPSDPNNPLSGKRVVFTGDLERWSRQEAVALLIQASGLRQSAPNRRTDYVVVGRMPGQMKMEHIRQLQSEGECLQVIDEEQFLNLLRKVGIVP